jgi:hypothetical protein
VVEELVALGEQHAIIADQLQIKRCSGDIHKGKPKPCVLLAPTPRTLSVTPPIVNSLLGDCQARSANSCRLEMFTPSARLVCSRAE